jgi:hypothetical protein
VTLRRPAPRSPQDRRRRPLLPVVVALAGFAAIAAAPTGADPAPLSPRCFGAAARVPGHPCRNPALRLSVVPSPQDAVLVPDLPCRSLERSGALDLCGFGESPAATATETVALLGDSHASQWRAALDVAATSAGWRGISLTRSSCPFTTARARIAPEARGPCREHNREVVAWLRAHPEVHTVFVSAHTGAYVFHDRGRSGLQTKVHGYRAAWRSLPASVRRIVVLRDVFTQRLATTDCIELAMRRRRPAAPACASRRSHALRPDPQVIAVRQAHAPPRVAVVDLTAFMCSARRCFPVVGGVLVHKDTNHLSQQFSTTLGPYLLRHYLTLFKHSQRAA